MCSQIFITESCLHKSSSEVRIRLYTEYQLPGYPWSGWKAIDGRRKQEEEEESIVNNGQLRLRTPPCVVHTSRLDQYNWFVLFQAENGQNGASNQYLYRAECPVCMYKCSSHTQKNVCVLHRKMFFSHTSIGRQTSMRRRTGFLCGRGRFPQPPEWTRIEWHIAHWNSF